MPANVVVMIELRHNYISICGAPLKYAWHEDLEFFRPKKPSKAFAMIDPTDLSSIFILVESRRFCVRAKPRPPADVFEFTMQEGLWGKLSLKIFRRSKGSKRYNEEQVWIDAVIPQKSKLSLLKINS
jgi:hypothetical protein